MQSFFPSGRGSSEIFWIKKEVAVNYKSLPQGIFLLMIELEGKSMANGSTCFCSLRGVFTLPQPGLMRRGSVDQERSIGMSLTPTCSKIEAQ